MYYQFVPKILSRAHQEDILLFYSTAKRHLQLRVKPEMDEDDRSLATRNVVVYGHLMNLTGTNLANLISLL